MRLLLTSAGFKNPKVHQAFLAMMRDVRGHAMIITTASEEWKERNTYAVLMKEAFETDGFDAHFVDVEFDDPEKMREASVIYINGGNPFYLLHHLKRSGADRTLTSLAERDIPIIGTSAGAVVMGPNIDIVNFMDGEKNTVRLNDLSALHWVPFTVYPHYTPQHQVKMEEFRRTHATSLITLTNDQAILAQDGQAILME